VIIRLPKLSSCEGYMVDVLALRDEEGRGRLR